MHLELWRKCVIEVLSYSFLYFLFYWFMFLFAWGCQDCWGCYGFTSVLPTGHRVALSSSSTSLVLLPGRSDDWVRAKCCNATLRTWSTSGWWFWNMWIIFPFICECHTPNWLSYFSEELGSTTNQTCINRFMIAISIKEKSKSTK